jgi:arylsulfatase A-like enzyme
MRTIPSLQVKRWTASGRCCTTTRGDWQRYGDTTDYREYTYKRSIITPDDWKLIYTLENKGRELYNLKTDPGETRNLADAEPKLADELEERLFSHFNYIGHDLRVKRWEIGLNPVYPSQGKEGPKK